MKPPFTITAASTALFSTWVFIEECGVLFDAGDGVAATLLQKSRKIKHIFITHADRDHLCGLLQLLQLNARNGVPNVYYPKDCGSFPALKDFVRRFDPQSGPATWHPLTPGSIASVSHDLSVLAADSSHIIEEGKVKALNYTLRRSKRHLKADFRGLPGEEIASIRKCRGEEVITDEVIESLIGYSGDTPELDVDRWQDHKILIHECTFLDAELAKRSHSHLSQVISAAADLKLEALVLLHFSSRHRNDEIRSAAITIADNVRPAFPIYVIFPGQPLFNMLSQAPLWRP